MVDYMDDTVAWPTMLEMLGCLREQIRARNLPDVCRLGPVPGPLAIIDACSACGQTGGSCGGQAWVRHVTEYPSDVFPNAAPVAGCYSEFAYTLELGIMRCLPTGTTSNITGFVPPSEADNFEATRLQMADKVALRAAIQCCVSGLDVSYALGGYNPIAAGDCGGGAWLTTIWTQ